MAATAPPIDVTGRSDLGEPVAALRQALWMAGAALIQAGGMPATMTGMVWTSPDPAAVHPSRREIELIRREATGGFLPPVTLSASETTTVRITAHRASPPPDGPVWRSFPQAEFMREYSPRAQVPDLAAVFLAWSRAGAAFLADKPGRDLRYGTMPEERLDLHLPPGVRRPPVWAFIHGGYWQACTKEQHAQFTAGMLRAGFAVANIEYALAPSCDLRTIARQITKALCFIRDHADALGVDGEALHVCGHSAGGHLAAMAACDLDAPPLRSALPISGLFDLEPIALLPMASLLGLDRPGAVAALSPLRRQPRCKVSVAVGALESSEFIRQSAELAAGWSVAPALALGEANHFTVLDGLNAGPLLELALATARG